MSISVTITTPTAAEIAALVDIANGLSGTGGTTGGGTGGGGTTGGGTTGGGTTPPPSQPILPMPSGITNGAPVTIGTGPDQIQILIANNPSDASSGLPNNIFVVLMDGTPIAGPLTVTSNGGESIVASQIFTILGSWGTGPHTISIVGSGTGLIDTWINQVTYNFVPYVYNGVTTNSRGGANVVNAASVWDNTGITTTWTLPVAVVTPPPTPVVTPSNVTGATINGVVQTAAPLSTLIAATPTGGTLVLPAGTINGTSTIPNACTINGAGMGNTIIDCTGISPTYSKAVLVPLVPGVTISNVTIKGANISTALGNNAAGVRESGVGDPFTLTNVELTGNQDGILTFADNITLTGGSTHNNGAGDGYTHEMYINGDTTNTATLTNWNSTCGLLSTHALKTRAGTTIVSGGTFTGSPDTTGAVGGSVIDVPDAGLFTATGTTFVIASGAANLLFLGYGMESTKNAAIGITVTFNNCVFTDNTGKGGYIQNGTYNPTATIVFNNCTYTGTVAPTVSGFGTVTGVIAKA